MKKNDNFFQIYFKLNSYQFIFTIYFILQLSKKIICECGKEIPILKNGSCVNVFCTQEEFDENICSINNTIVKTQRLNNIIWIGDKYFRYINLITYSNGDLIVETSSTEGTSKRMFYGIKKNGRSFFKGDKKKTKYYSIEVSTQEGNPGNARYYSEIFVAKINGGENDSKEYIVNVGKGTGYTELYDFDNNKIYQRSSVSFLPKKSDSLRAASFTYNFNGIFYSNLYHYNEANDYYYLNKYEFTTYDIENDVPKKTSKYIPKAYGNTISCYLTELYYTICFFTLNIENYIVGFTTIFDKDDFTLIGQMELDYLYSDKDTFLKCIYFKDEIGIFVYYYFPKTSVSQDTNKIPRIIFKGYKCDSNNNTSSDFICQFTDYSPNFKEIDLDKIQCNINNLLNDIIKINDNKICFIGTSESRDMLYIAILNIFSTEKVVIRYYNIELYNFYHYQIFSEIKAHLFNNFISFAFSFCPNIDCAKTTDEHYSAFMIFSYPNGTDDSLNITDYLLRNNDIKINNIIINLKDNLYIENNIFGFEFSQIKIINITDCDNIILYSTKTENKILTVNDYLDKNENIKLYFLDYDKFEECKIAYSNTVTESSYQNDINYYTNKSGNDTEETYNSQKDIYVGRVIYYTIKLEKNLVNNCQNISCELCLEDNTTYCITCKNEFEIFEIEDKIEYKNCIDKDLNEEENKTQNKEDEQSEKEETFKIPDEIICTNDQILNGECKEGIMTEKQISECYNQLKDEYLTPDYERNNVIVQTQNAVFQFSNLEDQKYNENLNISSIDLGECEEILKKKYNLSIDEPLIILKTDLKNLDGSSTYVQYEIYHPYTLEKLNMYYCQNVSIVVNRPINLNEETISLYNRLNKSGYNLFDENDSFFTDVCTTYTSENGTDVSLNDRKNHLYKNTNNVSLCQVGCNFESYNSTTKKAKCNCEVQKNNITTNVMELDFKNNIIIQTFLYSFKYSNIKVLKCYKFAFDFSTIIENIGRIAMTIILVIYLILLSFFLIKDRKKIDDYINNVLQNKTFRRRDKKSKTVKAKNQKIGLNINKTKINNKDVLETKIRNNANKRTFRPNKIKKNVPPKRKSQKNLTTKMNQSKNNLNDISQNELNSQRDKKSKGININIIPINNVINYKNSKTLKYNAKKKKSTKIKKTKSISHAINIYHKSKVNNKRFSNNLNNNNNLIFTNDQELNSLSYKNALIYDKRTYFQYYKSLIRKNHLIIFAFFPNNDYNLLSMKLLLFLLSLSLYFTMNGIFFFDDAMHRIFMENGSYNILYQIPKLFYSIILCSFLNTILKLLSLCEYDILRLKHEIKLKESFMKTKSIKSCIMIKFIVFFSLSTILLLFCWYFISCFCGVYINTQIILLKDILISFGFSMIYPFGLNLIPGIFRIYALRAQKQDKKFFYALSSLLAILF